MTRLNVSIGLAIGALLWACASGPQATRYSRKQAQTTLASLEAPGVLVGEFEIAPDGVIDGDTIRVKGIKTTLRLLALDAEETFKNEADRRAAFADFGRYLIDKRKGRSRPTKAATPMGEQAKKWARKFFADVTRIRLERDHPKEIRGRFNRYLTYVFAYKDGAWINYNVECVRAGMSPYFTKYGYSRRFHRDFVAAENQARAARRGIWDPATQSYPDYDARKAWWDARAEFIAQFERDAGDKPDHIMLTNWDAIRRIEAHQGKQVTLLATVGAIRLGDRGPTRVMLSRRRGNDFALIFFDKDVFGSSEIERFAGEYVRVSGTITTYFNNYRKQTELQMVINRPGQIVGSEVPGLAASAARSIQIN